MSIEATAQGCKNCRFALKSNYYDQYDCRRRSPVAEHVEHHQDLRGWVPRFPIMRGKDWCGEYEQTTKEADQ